MKQHIVNMISLLQDYKHDKESLMQKYVSERLSKSFIQYDKELQQTLEFLTYKHEKSLVKRINKLT